MLLPPDQAETLILDLVTPLHSQADSLSVSLSDALGRILARPMASQLDFPHWDNSAMDGYAVRYEDVQTASTETPIDLTVIEEIPAGKIPQQAIASGQAARILTGAMLPSGTDTIVIQENTQRNGNRVRVLAAPAPQAFVRHQASFYQAGKPLLAAGIRLMAPDIAVLAAAQCTDIPVYRRPKVAIFSTGDELVEPDQPLKPGQIVDSNQYALAALVTQLGAEPINLGIVPDDEEVLRQVITKAATTADIILSSGGVSVGDYDYVDSILTDLDATIHIRSVAVKPGKPLTVATLTTNPTQPPCLYFGLPGNPASALVTFWRFVAPAIRKYSGLAMGWTPTLIPIQSEYDLRAGGQRETYLWGHCYPTDTGYKFTPAGGGHNSGNLINLAQTNALAIIPIGQRQIPAGMTLKAMLVGELLPPV